MTKKQPKKNAAAAARELAGDADMQHRRQADKNYTEQHQMNNDGSVRIDTAPIITDTPLTQIAVLERYKMDPEEWEVLSFVARDAVQWLRKQADIGQEHTAYSERCWAYSLKAKPRVKLPIFEPVQQIPVTVRSTRKPKPAPSSGRETAFIFPDAQIGYRRDPLTGALEPFHDEACLDALRQVARALQPNLVVDVGDMNDLPGLSKFAGDPSQESVGLMQAGVSRCTLELAWRKADCPNARQILLEGNHDDRLMRWVKDAGRAAYMLRKGVDGPEEYPVMSIPALLGLDELGVEYIGEYPDGRLWLNPTCAIHHGHNVASGGSTAARIANSGKTAFSSVTGHIHRGEFHSTRVEVGPGEMRETFTMVVGTAGRLDGAVPGVGVGTNPKTGQYSGKPQWTQYAGVVSYLPDVAGSERAELVPVVDGVAYFRGNEYVADTDRINERVAWAEQYGHSMPGLVNPPPRAA